MIKKYYYILFLSVIPLFLEGMHQQLSKNAKNNLSIVQKKNWIDTMPAYTAPAQAIGYFGYLLMQCVRK